VEAQTDRVVQRLNRLFLEELQPQFAAHHEAVEATVQDVTLPEHVGGNLRVYWEQLKSPVWNGGPVHFVTAASIWADSRFVRAQLGSLQAGIRIQFPRVPL